MHLKLKRLFVPAALIAGSVIGQLASAQSVPKPEYPPSVDSNHVNLISGSLTVRYDYGGVGPERYEMQRALLHSNHGLNDPNRRDNLKNYGIFYDVDDDEYIISAESVEIRFVYDYVTNEFSPIGPTSASLENVAGDEDFEELIYYAENGAIYTFYAVSGPGGRGSGTLARIWKIEYPDGEVWENVRSLVGGKLIPTTNGFRYNNLGYSSYPYLTNLGHTRCESTPCSEYISADWPGEHQDPGPTFTLHNPEYETIHLGNGDTAQLGPRYNYGLITYANGDTIRGNFDMEFTTTPGGIVPNPTAKVLSVQRFGKTWTYEHFDGGANYTDVTHPSGVKHRYEYNAGINRIIRHTVFPTDGSPPLITRYGWSLNRLTFIQYHEGNVTRYVRDSVGRIIEVRKEAKPGSGLPDIVEEYEYEPCTIANRKYCSKPIKHISEIGETTEYEYSATHGGLTKIIRPNLNGIGWSKTNISYQQMHAWYRTSSSSTQVQDSRAVWKRTKEVNCVEATKATDCLDGTANGKVTEYFYEQGNASTPSNLNMIKMTERSAAGGLSVSVDYTYDTWGRVKTEDGPLPGTSDKIWYEYDSRNNVTRVTKADPDGAGPQRYAYTRTEYNLEDQITLEETGWTTAPTSTGAVDTRLSRTVYEFDTYGRPKYTKFLDASLNTVSVHHSNFDSYGRPWCNSLRMDPSTYSSLPSSACVQTASGEDRIIQTAFDAYDRAYKTTHGLGTVDQLSEEVSFTENGLVETEQDGNGNLTTHTFDGHDRLQKTQYPNKTGTGSSTTDYDQWSYLTANGNATSLEQSRRYRDGVTVDYQYDEWGRLKLTDAPGTADDVALTYDIHGNVKTETKNGITLTYNWDLLGRLENTQAPLGTVSYLYDAAGRRTRITYPDGFYVSYEYSGSGGVDLIKENGSLILADYDYDAFRRKEKITLGNGIYTSYGYDLAGRPDEIDSIIPLDPTYNRRVDFTRNAAGQIKTAVHSNTSYLPSPAVESRTYGVNGLNQLTEENSGLPFGYTGRGSLTADGIETYGYDVYNQLTNVGTTALAYDAAGRLSELTVGGVRTDFVYDGVDLLAEYDSSGNVLRRYVHGHGSDDPIVWYEGSIASNSTRRYLVSDERGSIVFVSTNAGYNVTQNTYDSFGRPDAANLGRFQYTGQIWLDGTELYHYKARAYSPRLGRFLQTDPIGYEDGLNWYAYVGNDPVNGSDPTGEFGVVGFAVGFASSVASQIFIEGRSLSDVNLVAAGLDGAVGATGLGAAVQARKLHRAYKAAESARKKALKTKRQAQSRIDRGKDASRAKNKLEGVSQEYTREVLKSVESSAKLGGAAALNQVGKETLPEVTIGDVASIAQQGLDQLDSAIDEGFDTLREEIDSNKRHPGLEVNISGRRSCELDTDEVCR